MNQILHLTDASHPAAQAFLLVAFGLVGLCLRCYRTAAVFSALGILWVALCATPAFARLLERGLENQYPHYEAGMYPTADAIVVLGGATFPHLETDWVDESPSLLKSRLGFGFELFMQARAPIIMLSGSGGDAVAMAMQLTTQAVPTSAMRLETRSGDTHENAALSAVILKHEGLRRILLVTSSMHMPRAAASFRRQGLVVIPAPAQDLPEPATQATTPWQPQAVLLRSRRSLREYLGLFYYKLRGWA